MKTLPEIRELFVKAKTVAKEASPERTAEAAAYLEEISAHCKELYETTQSYLERARCRNLYESIDNVCLILKNYGFADERVGSFFGLIQASKESPSFEQIGSGRGRVKKPTLPLPATEEPLIPLLKERDNPSPKANEETLPPPPEPKKVEERTVEETPQEEAKKEEEKGVERASRAVVDVPTPETLGEFIGQEHIVSRLKEEIAVAKILGQKSLDNVLLQGNRGLGKTTLMKLIAKELGVDFQFIDCTSIRSDERSYRVFHEFFQRIARSGEPVVIAFDEIHALPVRLQSNLLTLLNDRVYSYLTKDGAKTLRMPPFTFIAATTDYDAVLVTLKDRCSNLTFTMKDYTRDELRRIFIGKLNGMGLIAEDEVINQSINRCRSSIRDVTAIVKGVYSKAVLAKTNVVTKQIAEDYFTQAGIDSIGLKEVERRVLSAIANEEGGFISGETLAARVYLDLKVLTKEYEPFLLKIGLISITSRGRSLTLKGERYLSTGYYEFDDGTTVGEKSSPENGEDKIVDAEKEK